MAVGNTLDELFSTSLIASYVEHDQRFVERPWFDEQLHRALADPSCRFLLLTGSPGAGKTAAMAWLAARDQELLRYFVRRDSRNPLSSGDARSLLLAIGHQLSATRPALFRPDRLEVVVQQRIADLRPGGRAVGISVEDLYVSPFYRTALTVEQEVGVVAGEVVGISARRAVLDPRLLDPGNLQHLALLAPAALLHETDPDARIVILVDAIDEIRYQASQDTLLDWLASVAELPPNILFVLASRPDDGLLNPLRRRQSDHLREAAVEDDAEAIRRDIVRCARRYAVEPGISHALAMHGMPAEDFIAGSVTKAAGNFQYLSALYRAIDDADAATVGRLLDFAELPTDLGDLYAFFLDLAATAVRGELVELQPISLAGRPQRVPAWETLYEPLLALLAVAYAPVTADQLARFLGSGDEEVDYRRPVKEALHRLRQFLRSADGLLSLYHDTFRTYFTTGSRRPVAESAHRRIAQSYRAGRSAWDDVAWAAVDEYGLTYLLQHVEELSLPEELTGLLGKPLLVEKARRYGSNAPFASDARLVARSAAGRGSEAAPGAGLADELRARWIEAKLGALAHAVSPDLIAVVARTGAGEQALGLAELVPDAAQRAIAYVAAGAELVKAGENAAARQGLDAAVVLLESLPIHQGTAALVPLAQAYARLGDLDGLERLGPLTDMLPTAEKRADSYALLAHVYAQTGAPELCLEWASRLPTLDTDATARACRSLIRTGHRSTAIDLAERVPNREYRAQALAAVAHELIEQGQTEEGAALATRVLREQPRDAVHSAATALALAGRPDEAEALVEQLPDADPRVAGRLALATASTGPEAFRLARVALDDILASAGSSPWPADLFLQAAPALGNVGDRDLLRSAYQVARLLPDDGYGSSGRIIARYAEAFAQTGDTEGIDAALSDAAHIQDNSFAQEALVGVARACADTGHGLADVRAYGRQLHRHFVEPWAIDVEVAFSLAEAGRMDEARELAAALLAEVQAPDDVEAAITWRRGAADALADHGRLEEAARLCADGLAKAEALAVSGDEEMAAERAPYIMELGESAMTVAVAEGMEWSRVVRTSAPILPVLARTGSEERLDAAITRLSEVAELGWPAWESAAVLAGGAADALLRAGRAEEAAELLASLPASRVASDLWARFVPKLVAAGESALAVRGAQQVLDHARNMGNDEVIAHAAVALDAAGATDEATTLLGAINDPQERAMASWLLAKQALDRADTCRARQLTDSLLDAMAELPQSADQAFYMSCAVPLLARLTQPRRAGELNEEVLSTLRSSEFERYAIVPGVLARLAEGARRTGDQAAFRAVLHTAVILGSPEDAVAAAAVEATADWLADALGGDAIPDALRAALLTARALALHTAGDRREALLVWRQALALDKVPDVNRLATRIHDGAALIAALDGGQTLQDITRALTAVDAWWQSGPWLGATIRW